MYSQRRLRIRRGEPQQEYFKKSIIKKKMLKQIQNFYSIPWRTSLQDTR